MGFFDFFKEVADSATKDQEEKDSTAYKIGDALDKGSQNLFDNLFGSKKKGGWW